MSRRVGFLAAALLAASDAPAFVTAVSPISDDLNERTECPTGYAVLGGGMDPELSDSMVASVLAPLDEFLPSFNFSFTVVVRDLGDPHDAYRIGAICGTQPSLEIVEDDFPVAAGGIGVDSVQCPLGKVALSGGQSLSLGGFATDGTVVTSAPYFPVHVLAPDLTDRAAGVHDAPGGWKSARLSEGPAGGGAVQAVCSTAENVVTVVEDATAAAGAVDTATAFCPAGMSAVGGGLDAVDRAGLRIASSAPVFSGFPLVRRLFAMDTGTAGDPIGWRVALRNESGAAKPYKLAAVCVPEPEGAAFAAAAALLLARALRRARR